MAPPRYVQLYIDLPNLTNGGNVSILKITRFLEGCVKIALQPRSGVIPKLILSYVVYDDRYLHLLKELGPLAIKLGLTLVYTPRLTDGMQEKETVDQTIVRLLNVERFMVTESVRFILVSDDQDFGVHFADLRHFGHEIETITPGSNPTLLGWLATREHSLDGEEATKRLHLYRTLMDFVEERSLQIGRLIDKIKDLASYDRRQITNMAVIVAAINTLLERGTRAGQPVSVRFEDLRRIVGQAARDHGIPGVTGSHQHWLTHRICDSKIVVPAAKGGRNKNRLKLDDKHRLIRIVRDEWRPMQKAAKNPPAKVIDPPPEEPDAVLEPDEVATVTDDGPALAAVPPPFPALEEEEPEEDSSEVSDAALQSALEELLRGTPLDDPERRPNRLARRLRDHLSLETRREGEHLLLRAFSSGWIATANERKGSPYLLEEELAQARAG